MHFGGVHRLRMLKSLKSLITASQQIVHTLAVRLLHASFDTAG